MTKYIAKLPDANGYIDFSAEENAIWEILYNRQLKIIPDRACPEYLDGLAKLKMPHDRIPQCAELSTILQAHTGWSVVPVAAIIPLTDFFNLLAHRQFPAASFIRVRAELDYLQEPDIFHEYFGHCPLLMHAAYADFVQWYGAMALQADKKTQSLLGRLFWYTIEFGLIETPRGLRIFGGGILSSYQETLYCLENPEVQRLPFSIEKMLLTPYRYDEIQMTYFILKEMAQLFLLKSDAILRQAAELTQETQMRDFVIC
jgi:phenylalanine-4-hydroxylase